MVQQGSLQHLLRIRTREAALAVRSIVVVLFGRLLSPSLSAAVALTPAAESTYGTALLTSHSGERMGERRHAAIQ
jgi:hypothetical protein